MSWLVSTAAVGARGDLQGIAKKKYCPACQGITDEMFALTLPHVLQVCEAVWLRSSRTARPAATALAPPTHCT